MSPPRTHTLQTPHGEIHTPVFMPVGTQGTVKAVTVDTLEDIGAQIILGNTYHLMLRPGPELMDKLGGLHKFMAWNKPILTDSGGFQVFSLTGLRKMTEDGVKFQSHIDGSPHFLSPERAVSIQQAIGSDIMMVLDECPPYPVTEAEAQKSLDLTLRWAERSLQSPRKHPERTESEQPHLFGIVQGSTYPHLRKQSVERLVEMSEKKRPGDQFPHFGGIAIGGLSVGEPKEELYNMAREAAAVIPDKFPRYAMGVGMPEDLVELVGMGIDMFDCVIPTRNARNGELFTSFGEVKIKQAQYREDPRPIDENCSCPVCQKYCRAYLRHLYVSGEILSSMLNTIHNLHYYITLLKQLREAIEQGTYHEFRQSFYLRRGSTAS